MEATGALCSVCGHENPADNRFCAQCGSALPQACTSCGAENSRESRFCATCGNSLTGGQPDAQRRVAAPSPNKERRLVTVLFADLVGSTQLGETLDAEELDELITQVNAITEESVRRFGGTVVRHLGDGLMAIFGAPVAREDDAERAVLAGFEMQRALQDFNAQSPPGTPELHMRVGITSGEVVAGDMAGIYDVLGDAANTASRLQDQAPVDGVLVGEETMQLAQRRIAFGEPQSLRLKGKAEPVIAVTALGIRDQFAERWEVRAQTSPLVGRDRELGELLGAWQRAQDGNGQLISILGEAGVGKSRLISELTKAVSASRVLHARCLSYSQHMSLWLVADLLRSVFNIGPHDASDTVRENLQAVGDQLFAAYDPQTRADSIDVIGEAVGMPLNSSTMDNAGPQVRRQVLIRSLRHLLAELSLQGPLLVILEDMHWLDDASQDVLLEVLPDVPGMHVLVLPSHRPGWNAPWSEWGWTEQLTVRPLEDKDAAALALAVLGGEALSPDLAKYMSERAGGNPFFIEEMLTFLKESNQLEQRGGLLHVRREAAERLPTTLTELLLARLDRLDTTTRSTAQVASVIGRSFAVRLLAWITQQADRDLDGPLASLQRAEIAFPRRTPEYEYVFKHASMRDVAYNTLLHRRRQDLHLAAAQAIAELYPADEYVEMIAYHYARTEAHERAAAWLERAGDRAASVFDSQAALTYFQDAQLRLDQVAAARGNAAPAQHAGAAVVMSPDAASARLDEKRGKALRTLARYDEALEALERAARFHHGEGHLEDEARVLAAIGQAHYDRGTADDGVLRLKPFADKAGKTLSSQVPAQCMASVDSALTLLLFAGGRHREALEAAERALTYGKQTGDDGILARAGVSRGLALLALSRTRDAQAALEEAVPLAEAAGDLTSLAQAFDNLSNIVYFSNGDFEKARMYLQRGLEVAERMGDPASTAHMLFMMGTTWIWTDNQDKARSLFERVQEIVESQSLGESRVASQPSFGFAYLETIYGDPEKARREWEDVILLAEQTGALPMVRWASRWLAELDLQLGEQTRVIERLEPLLQRPGFEDSPTLLSPLAMAYAAAGREHEAEVTAELAVRNSREQNDMISLMDALHAAVVVAIRRKRWDDAERFLQEGLALFRAIGYGHGEATLLAERGAMHAAMGKVEESRRDLEEALGIFRGIGATRFAQRTEQALAGAQIGP